MTYNACRQIIENNAYGTKEEMLFKLDIFLLNNRISQLQYNELVALLNTIEGDSE